jgi:hypothetical protein
MLASPIVLPRASRNPGAPVEFERKHQIREFRLPIGAHRRICLGGLQVIEIALTVCVRFA